MENLVSYNSGEDSENTSELADVFSKNEAKDEHNVGKYDTDGEERNNVPKNDEHEESQTNTEHDGTQRKRTASSSSTGSGNNEINKEEVPIRPWMRSHGQSESSSSSRSRSPSPSKDKDDKARIESDTSDSETEDKAKTTADGEPSKKHRSTSPEEEKAKKSIKRRRSRSPHQSKSRKSGDRKRRRSRDRERHKSREHHRRERRSSSKSRSRKERDKEGKIRSSGPSHKRSRSRSRDRNHGRSHRRPSSHSHSPDRRHRHKRRRRRRSSSRGRSPQHHGRREKKEEVPPKKANQPVTYKEALKQQLMEAQKHAAATGGPPVVTLPQQIPVSLSLNAIKPLLSQVTAANPQVTPQEALQQTMAAMQQKAQELTGIAVPKFYNPTAVNPLKYADQVKKRKLLWSKNKETKETQNQAGASSSWQAMQFAGDKDGKMTEKFRKLMGIKEGEAPGKPEEGLPEHKDLDPEQQHKLEEQMKKQAELFENLDKEYEFARMTTHTHRGVGLGFASQGMPGFNK